jgi:hypothetical protein
MLIGFVSLPSVQAVSRVYPDRTILFELEYDSSGRDNTTDILFAAGAAVSPVI